MPSIEDDPRIDPRIKALLAFMPATSVPDGMTRDEMIAAMATPEAIAAR